MTVDKKTALRILIGIAVLIVVGVIGYFAYGYYQRLQFAKNNPGQITDNERKILVKKIGIMMELPVGEEPSVATVLDLEKLKGQPFFAKAQKGDRVLIYTNAQKVILYRPSTNKIIDVSTLVAAPTPASAAPIKVAIYNGTNTVEISQSLEQFLKTKVTNIEVVGNAKANKLYDKSFVVDVNGTNDKSASQLADFLKIAVGNLPKSEATPSSELLIVIGKDLKLSQ